MKPWRPVLIFGLLAAHPAALLAQTAPQDSAVVSELVVRPPDEAPVPKVGQGAPLYTPGEIVRIQEEARKAVGEARSSVRRCSPQAPFITTPETVRAMLAWAFGEERDAALKVERLSAAAEKASLAAQDVRRRAAKGEARSEEMEKAELARQAAVNALVTARNELADASAAIPVMQQLIGALDPPPGSPRSRRDWELVAVARVMPQVQMFKTRRAAERIKPPASPFADLAIRNVVVRESEDRRGRFLSIAGEVLNTRPRAIPIPSLQISQQDGFGFTLDEVTADPVGRQIDAGAAARFSYEFRPKAARAEKVTVSFASAERLPIRRPAGAPIGPMPTPNLDASERQPGQISAPVFAARTAGANPDEPPDCSG